MYLVLIYYFIAGFYQRYNSSYSFFVLICILSSVVPIYLYRSDKRPLKHLGFQRNKLVKQIILGVITSILIFFLVIIVFTTLGADIQVRSLTIKEMITNLLVGIFLIGFGEEVLFRGFFLDQIYLKTNSIISAVILSSLLFGLIHYIIQGNMIQTIFSTLFGLFVACLYKKGEDFSIISLTLTHGLYDFLIKFFSIIIN